MIRKKRNTVMRFWAIALALFLAFPGTAFASAAQNVEGEYSDEAIMTEEGLGEVPAEEGETAEEAEEESASESEEQAESETEAEEPLDEAAEEKEEGDIAEEEEGVLNEKDASDGTTSEEAEKEQGDTAEETAEAVQDEASSGEEEALSDEPDSLEEEEEASEEDAAADQTVPAEEEDPADEISESPAEEETETAASLAEDTQVNKITSLQFKDTDYTLYLGVSGQNTYQLEVEPQYDASTSYETNEPYYFYSSDESVVKVDENGLVTAVGTGSADIYVHTGTGSYSYEWDYKDSRYFRVYETAYKIHYDLNGGKANDSYSDLADKVVEGGSNLYLPSSYELTRSGYRLLGWTETKNGADVLTGRYTPSKNVTLYAKWQRTYTVSFDPNGGTFESSYYGQDRTVDAGSSCYLSSGSYVATKAGYIMVGWKEKGGTTIFTRDYKPTQDVTLYAVWKTAYTVKFNVNGGSFTNSYYGEDRVIQSGKTTYLSTGDSVATKSGYILTGWKEKNGTTIYSEDYKPTKNVTLYAVWKTAYTVKFNANGGSFTNSYYGEDRLIQSGKTTYLSTGDSVATKSGYILTGWKEKNGTTIYSENYKPTKNVTLYANWVKAYTVTFNAGSGYFGTEKTAAKKTRKVATGTTAGNILGYSEYEPVNGSKVFMGWYKDSKLTSPVKKSDKITKNITWYAKWQSKSYKITVTNLKGASYSKRGTNTYVSSDQSTAASYSFYVEQGESIGHLYAYKNGEDARFFFDKDCKQKPYYSSFVPTANTTVYAKWYGEVTVKWNANGGATTYGEKTGEASSRKGLMCEELPYSDEMVRDGYYFVGWVDTADTSKVLPASHVFRKNTTVKAKWAKGIKIKFAAGGGKFRSGARTTFYVKAKTKLASTSLYVPGVSRSGYTLTGWKSSVTKKVVKSIYDEKPAKDTTYTAVWTKNASTVEVTLTGGAGSIYDSATGKYVTKLVVRVPKNMTYSKALYTYLNSSSHDEKAKKLSFVGWSATKNGKELSGSYKFTKKVTLYPVWKKMTYLRVALVSNGGAIDKEPTNDPYVLSVQKGGTISLPTGSRIEREGYTFLGWYTDFNRTKKVSNTAKFKPSKNCYLYAKWKKK